MSILKYDFQTARVPASEIESTLRRLAPIRKKLASGIDDVRYSTQAAFMYSPFDLQAIDRVCGYAHEKKALKPALIFLIGIGGSNLGALAVFKALYGGLFNDLSEDRAKFYCMDTVDDLLLKNLLQCAERVLEAGREIIIIIASKSGTTLETLINASFFIELLKKYRPDYNTFVIVLTEKESSLRDYADTHKILCIDVPRNVGGRYSVFTATGLFPLAMMGVDVKALCGGAQPVLFDDAAASAAAMYFYWKKKYAVYDIFVSAPRFIELGLWYRQLIGESIGKRFSVSGELVETGITPTVSVATADLHSVGQLYLGGPRDRLTLFVLDKESGAQSAMLTSSVGLVPDYIEKKNMQEIKNAILSGVMHAYENDNRPFAVANFTSITPQALGAFLYSKMMEIVCLGFLMQVDPFDQPQVEEYKRETQRILKS